MWLHGVCSHPVKVVKSAYESTVLTQHSWILAGVITTPLIHPTTQVKGYERAAESRQVYKGEGEIHISLSHTELKTNNLGPVSWFFIQPSFERAPGSLSEMWQSPAYCHFSHSLAVFSYIQPPSQWENLSLVTFLHRTLGFLHNWEVL